MNEQGPQITKSVAELIDEANEALRKMSKKNSHRHLMYMLATGLSTVADMVGARDAEIHALKQEILEIKKKWADSRAH